MARRLPCAARIVVRDFCRRFSSSSECSRLLGHVERLSLQSKRASSIIKDSESRINSYSKVANYCKIVVGCDFQMYGAYTVTSNVIKMLYEEEIKPIIASILKGIGFFGFGMAIVIGINWSLDMYIKNKLEQEVSPCLAPIRSTINEIKGISEEVGSVYGDPAELDDVTPCYSSTTTAIQRVISLDVTIPDKVEWSVDSFFSSIKNNTFSVICVLTASFVGGLATTVAVDSFINIFF